MQQITDKQLSMIKHYFIRLGGYTKPSEVFLKWYDKQSWEDLEAKAAKLSKYEASCIISESVTGNFNRAQELWQQFTTKK